ncbi:hypothetical protein [Haladaptatus sp. CMSO5]|uniref:hypothetical protein n=1 Tax=Haladaptatus sp. CMSO5 TaxID=3120514 RepID=UPI002FCDFD27
MQNPGLGAFAKAREEIQFWPAANLVYFYTITDSKWILAGILLFLVTGGITYKIHEAIRRELPEQKNITKVKRQNSRRGDKYDSGIGDFAVEFWKSSRPENATAKRIAVIAMALNVGAFFVFLLLLPYQLLSSATPSVTAVGLISLPLLMLAIIGGSVVWTA